MEEKLKYCTLTEFTTSTGFLCRNLKVSYQLFGKSLHTAPIVLVVHALTGNSNVTGKQGWWKGIVNRKKIIDTEKYTLIAFNIPGNGYDAISENLIHNYKDFSCRDIAFIFQKALKKMNINYLYTIIGGSLGGGIVWEMAVSFVHLAEQFILVAADWKATDWILGYAKAQEQVLLNSTKPLYDCRIMGMLFYRTPQSLTEKFNRSFNEDLNIPNVESWLLHHAETLQKHFSLPAYKMVNHLLTTLDITKGRGDFEKVAAKIEGKIVQIGIDSDLFFLPEENKITHKILKKLNKDAHYKEIKSIHGHDAFLIECEQLESLLTEYFLKN